MQDLTKQTGQQKEQRHKVQSVFANIDIVKMKLLVVNSAITEVNELKNIFIAIFRLTFRLILRLNFSNANF